VSEAFIKRVRKHWSSWENGMTSVLGIQTDRHEWSDEEILQLLRDLRAKLDRFPRMTDLEDVKKVLRRHVAARFGGLNNALEKALGDSPRLQILTALDELTPPSCELASTREIGAFLALGAVLAREEMELSLQEVGLHLTEMLRLGLVSCTRYSETAAWRLTAKGRTFLKDKKRGHDLPQKQR
jgi:DNA-binding transcriptional ArsR family regulator